MAQNFKNSLARNTGTSPVDILPAADSFDTVVGIRLVNVHASSSINVSVYIVSTGPVTTYLVKSAPIPFAEYHKCSSIPVSLSLSISINKYGFPIRAGLVYSESRFLGLDPKTTITLGTGKDFGRINNIIKRIKSYKHHKMIPKIRYGPN